MQPVNDPDRQDTANQFLQDNRLVGVLAAIPEGILVADARGIIQMANPAAARMFGFAPDDLTGASLKALISSLEEDVRNQKSNGFDDPGSVTPQEAQWEGSGTRKDGVTIPLGGSCAEIDGGQGSFVITLRDGRPDSEKGNRTELLCSALEQSPQPMIIVTAQGKIVYANAAFSRLADAAPGGLPAKFSAAANSAWIAAEQELAQHVSRFAPEKSTVHGGSLQPKAGDIIDTNSESVSPIRNRRGEITHFLLVSQEIGPRDETRQELEESEQRFRKVAEMAGEWLWEQDPQGRYTYSSAAVFDILGYRPEEMQGKYYLDILTPEDRQHWMHELPRSPNIPRKFHRLTNRYAHKDGHEVFTESTGEPLLDANGEILKWWGVDHDITARKRIEDEVRLRDRAIAAAHVGITILDARQSGFPLIYANPALCSMSGYQEDELLNRPQPFFVGSEVDHEAVGSLRTAMAEGSSCSVTLTVYRKDRSSFWSDLLMSSVKDESGRLTHFIWIVTDVSERKQAAEARRELETARQIQASLLPKAALHTADLAAAGIFLPSGEIGGDYFDYFVTPNGVNLTIADVSGHNVGAALIMTETRSALRAKTMTARAEGRHLGASKILGDLNELLFEDLNGAELFITMLYLEYDRVTRRLIYANAGHNPGLVARTHLGKCTLLDAEGLILGVKPQVIFEERSLLLKTGDVVLLYTDGVTEARNEQGELFGIERLSAQLIENRQLPVEDLIRHLVKVVQDFSEPAGLLDDTSMVALKIL